MTETEVRRGAVRRRRGPIVAASILALTGATMATVGFTDALRYANSHSKADTSQGTDTGSRSQATPPDTNPKAPYNRDGILFLLGQGTALMGGQIGKRVTSKK